MTTALDHIPGRVRRPRPAAPNTAIGYLRVSTDEQTRSGLGLNAQRAAITRRADELGITVVSFVTDSGVSGTVEPHLRLALAGALNALEAGDAGVLMAAKLDRLSRSTRGTLELVDMANKGGWRIITDQYDSLDNSPVATLQLSIYAMFSQHERDQISVRTREALAELKASGVALGKPTRLPDKTINRIISELSTGKSLRAIARGLEADGVPTATGRANWHPNQVKTAADSIRGRELAAAMFTTGGDQ